MSKFRIELSLLILLLVRMEQIDGHGMMLKPPNRSSLWRFTPDAPKNYNDNQNYCGGFTVQWQQHHGKCGVCGDNFADRIPRDNENTGTYGRGKVVAEYEEGSVIDVDILLTANHIGFFNYSLCRLTDPTKAETDDCFFYLKSPSGNYRFGVLGDVNHYTNQLQLPMNFTCDRCVLRWNYRAGNSWGDCGHGRGAVGCGPQEHFRSCSDIRIVHKGQLQSVINYTLIDDNLRPLDNNEIDDQEINLEQLEQSGVDFDEEQHQDEENSLIHDKYSHIIETNNIDNSHESNLWNLKKMENVNTKNNNQRKTIDIFALLKNRARVKNV